MDSVCQCKNEDHTVEICIGEIQRLNREANGFFTLLQERCEHNKRKTGLCYIPLELHPEPGILPCRFSTCPIIKEKNA